MAEIGEVGSLGRLMEKDDDLRELGRANKQLTEWLCEHSAGIPSRKALGCNSRLRVTMVDSSPKQPQNDSSGDHSKRGRG